MGIHERAMHAAIASRWAATGGWRGVVTGPGDDAAVVEGGGGVHWLITTDQLVSARHYEPGTPLERVAHKAVARSVSDIAAMAGEPKYALATALLPNATAHDHANDPHALFEAMDAAARVLACPLVGGDIASHDGDTVVLTSTVVGEAHGHRGAVLRSTATPGDALYVTGTIGAAMTSEPGAQDPRHLTFEPRVRAGWVLADMLGRRLRSMIDISDGLGIDAQRLGEASNVHLDIDPHAVPLATGINDWRTAVAQGEDYELLFTSPASEDEVASVGDSVGVPMTRIGTVKNPTDAPGAAFTDRHGAHPAADFGFEH